MNFGIEVTWIRLWIEGNDNEGLCVCRRTPLALTPRTDEVACFLSARPRLHGNLKILGCEMNLFNVVCKYPFSWGHGKSNAISNVKAQQGCYQCSDDIGVKPKQSFANVHVSAPLPLLRVREEIPSTERKLSALSGEIIDLNYTLVNTSKIDITDFSVSAMVSVIPTTEGHYRENTGTGKPGKFAHVEETFTSVILSDYDPKNTAGFDGDTYFVTDTHTLFEQGTLAI